MKQGCCFSEGYRIGDLESLPTAESKEAQHKQARKGGPSEIREP